MLFAELMDILNGHAHEVERIMERARKSQAPYDDHLAPQYQSVLDSMSKRCETIYKQIEQCKEYQLPYSQRRPLLVKINKNVLWLRAQLPKLQWTADQLPLFQENT